MCKKSPTICTGLSTATPYKDDMLKGKTNSYECGITSTLSNDTARIKNSGKLENQVEKQVVLRELNPDDK